jgi:mRNA-degrading endonuclease RelE of RelBE toxin-antitoxin system
MSYSVSLTEPFKRSVKNLKRRYPHVQADVQLGVEQLVQTPQLGVLIPGSNGIRKVRLQNRDARRGKSGGYRLLYYVEDEPNQTLYLLLIYSKSDRDDVTQRELRDLLSELWES